MSQCLRMTRSSTQLKDVHDKEERQRLLADLYAVDATQTCEKRILLFDDLFRSGDTLNNITFVLQNQGRTREVYVLTLTKTRSNQ